MSAGIEVSPSVASSLAAGEPVVGLESTVIAHGLPRPRNLEVALQIETAVRDAGAQPATIGILDGRVRVGLSEDELTALATGDEVVKVSLGDIAPVVSSRRLGATTVAATVRISDAVGVRVVSTGGIGGVHRGGEASLDISADLTQLGRSPVSVVCSGVKSVIDAERTLEVLETLGVPVVAYGTDELPAFYALTTGVPLEHRVDTPDQAARLMRAQEQLGAPAGIVFAHPPPPDLALPPEEVEAHVSRSLADARAGGLAGKALTPYLLEQLARRSGGRTLEVNAALLVSNARVAARIAAAYAGLARG